MYEYINRSLKRTQLHAVDRGNLIQPKVTPVFQYGTLVRCARMRENCAHALGTVKYLPPSSLMVAACEDGEGDVLHSEPYDPRRLEYCVRKTEDLREKGNVAFHDGDFRNSLEIYGAAVHYCLGACYLHAEMLVTFKDVEDARQPLLEQLKSAIPESSAFEIVFPTKNFPKKSRLDPPDVSDLQRVINAFKQVWELFLVMNLNAAQSALKLKSYQLALKFAEQAIQIDPSTVKGRYRRAMSLKGLGKVAEALFELKRARNLPDGNNDLVNKSIQELQNRLNK
jgi:tetratricopeptide (TPR) repeat protein